MSFKSVYVLLVFVISCSILACSSAERSAAMVLDNAGSVVKHEGDKIWIDPNATPTPSH
jgi:hypothetical protein